MGCPFCAVAAGDILAENAVAFVIRDRYPVADGHTLIVTKRHVGSWFDASDDEQRGLLALLRDARRRLDDERSPDGYNIGINVGRTAGQTVDHLHVHLIPRYEGDVDDPTGGVRGVIPGRGPYPR